jgi:glutaredoxin
MNLISIEEHLFFTANKTGNDKYYYLLNEIREMRKELLKEIIITYEGEVWCISKHLLSSSMRLMEVGTKTLGKGETEKAKSLFEKSYRLYKMFWEINLKLLDNKETLKKEKYSPNEIVMFFDIDCLHCKRTASFLAKNDLDSAFKIIKKEVSKNKDNHSEMKNMYKNCNVNTRKLEVPFVLYNGKCFMGEEEVLKMFNNLIPNVEDKTNEISKPIKETNISDIKKQGEQNKALEESLDCCKE